MRRVLPLVVLAVALGGGAAHADCYGVTQAGACFTLTPSNLPSVDPDGKTIDECVYLGGPCQHVYVPVPTVDPGGPVFSVDACWVLNSYCVFD